MLTLPEKPSSRTSWLSIRLSAEERAAVEALATDLGVTASHMARHFLMQAITYIRQNRTGQHRSEGNEYR
jgi:hypothetical protein